LRSGEGLKFSSLDILGSGLATSAFAATGIAASIGPLAIPAAISVAVAGALATRAAHALLLERTLSIATARYGRQTVQLLQKALQIELEMSALNKDISIASELKSRISQLQDIGLDVSESRIAHFRESEFVFEYTPERLRAWSRKLAERDFILIGVPAIHPSLVATVLYMESLIKRYTDARNTLRVNYSADRGISLLNIVNMNSPFDFLVVADSPLLHWRSSALNELYRLVLPVSSDFDTVLTRKSTVGDFERLKTVLYRPGTSAQDLATHRRTTGLSKETHALPVAGITVDDRSIKLEPGVGIATIAPYTDRLLNDKKLGLTQVGSPLKTPTSLYAERHWFTRSLEVHRVCFANLFLHSWLLMSSRPNFAVRILLQNHNFMSTFCNLVARE